MSTARSHRFGTYALVASSLMLLCSGCIMQGDVSAATSPAAAPAVTETSKGIDLSGGGQCEAGQDVYVNGQGLTSELGGACGTVHIEGADLNITVKDAKSVAIRGENNSITGNTWDSVLIQGATIKAEVDTAGSVEISGKDVTFNSNVSNALLITGDNILATTGDTRSVDITGANNQATAAKVTDFIVVDGVENSVTWTSGIKKENASAGERNTFNRP